MRSIHIYLMKKYIAIRDMYYFANDINKINESEILSAIEHSNLNYLYDDYKKTKTPYFYSINEQLVDFLLKYRYIENWDREKNEQYLWDWQYDIYLNYLYQHNYYTITYEDSFFIPYIRNQIKQDFNIDLPVRTHKKLLLERIDKQED